MFICLINALMPSENQQVLRLRLTYLMRRFLFLALGMGLLLPTAVNANSYWLIINRLGTGGGIEKIETKDMNQCLEQGEIAKKEKLGGYAIHFLCLQGK